MRIEQVIRRAIIASAIGAILTMTACPQDAAAPSNPSPAPQRSVSVPMTAELPAVGVPAFIPAVPTREANQPAPAAQWAPGGSVQAGAGTPPTDFATGGIGPQPQPGEEIVEVPEGDWTYLVPPESVTPEPEAPDTELHDSE
jgi:hypothetical protein